jgi:hypothetical protein
MRSTRKIDDEEDARRCLAAAERAGLTPRDWARENGVDARSLNTWRINLGRRRAVGELPPAALTLVELVPRCATASEEARSFGALHVLDLDGPRLEFGDDVSAATLRRAVEVLRSCWSRRRCFRRSPWRRPSDTIDDVATRSSGSSKTQTFRSTTR